MRKYLSLIFIVVSLLLAACGKKEVQPAAPPTEIPRAKSALVGSFLWQEDSRYAYAMLRPAHWKSLENGNRTYLPWNASDPAELSILAMNLQMFEHNGLDQFYIEPWEMYKQNPNLADWTEAMEQIWSKTGQSARIETVKTLDQAKIFAIHGDDGSLRLQAYIVDQEQPLLVVLDTRGKLGSLNQLQGSGLLDDFVVIVESARAIPYQPDNANPALPQ